MDKIVSVRNLSISFRQNIKVVKDINLDIIKGKTTALVGESGSGKTLSALSILKLLPNSAKITKGEIFFKNQNILSLPQNEIQKIRGNNIATIFQEPMTSLNPLHTINKQIEEIIITHNKVTKKERSKKRPKENEIERAGELIKIHFTRICQQNEFRILYHAMSSLLLCLSSLAIGSNPLAANKW